ncbi:IS630 family transposase [Actinocorallia libanotica]|uniref:Tc1-like transposase DDE domain-containing protein n=1 Tax=Actinocorallia libanotica TaxID=46162 RepID=A0ABN1RC67_9ACTN
MGITAFSTRSLAKPVAHLERIGLATSLSRIHLARVLKADGVSWQTTTTWKSSNDPNFIAKMQRILVLYDIPPDDGRVVCVDEFGPLILQSRKGRAWRPAGYPARRQATYNRNDGVRHLLGALDLATGRRYYRIRGRKRWREFLSFLKSLRRRRPGGRRHVILDNYSPHKHHQDRARVAANDVDLVFLSTYGSWPNWIESEFATLRYCALNATDHRSYENRTPRSAPTSAGATSTPARRSTSRPALPSVPGPVARPRLRDKPLVCPS